MYNPTESWPAHLYDKHSKSGFLVEFISRGPSPDYIRALWEFLADELLLPLVETYSCILEKAPGRVISTHLWYCPRNTWLTALLEAATCGKYTFHVVEERVVGSIALGLQLSYQQQGITVLLANRLNRGNITQLGGASNLQYQNTSKRVLQYQSVWLLPEDRTFKDRI